MATHTTEKMVNKPTLSFETAMKMLPKFDGIEHRDLNTFESACDFIFNNVDESIKGLVLQALISTLSGKAGEAIQFKTIASLGELKAILRSAFFKNHSISYLQLQLNSIEQEKNEKINNYANRIEKAYHELTIAQTEGRTPNTAKIINEVVKGEALSIFINGLITPIRNVVKARGVKTLEEAISIALEEEQSFESHKLKTNYHKNENFSKYNNHFKTNQNKPFINYQSRTYREQQPYIKQERNEVKIICAYCKKPNHHISECRKLKSKPKEQSYKTNYNNNYNSNNNSNNNPSTSRVRTVNEIQSTNNNNVMLATKLTNEHILCYSNDLVEQSGQFLIDSGSDMNLIKIGMLNGNVKVDLGKKRLLKGINDNAVCTIGTILMNIKIGNEHFTETFEVVEDNFPIPRTGILGKTFLKGNGVILDMNEEQLIIPDKYVKVPARSELIIGIKTPNELENKVLLLESQEVNKDITISNTLGTAINNQLITSIINTSENEIKLPTFKIDNLQ